MDWLQYLVAGLFFLLGAGCVVLVVLQLPGGWILLGLAVLIELVDRYYLTQGAQVTFGWWPLGGCGVLLGIGELVEFLAGTLGARRGGASRRGMIGALIGGVIGAVVLAAPLAVIPVLGIVFGAFFGAIIGSFAGALIGETSGAAPQTVRGSLRPATGK